MNIATTYETVQVEQEEKFIWKGVIRILFIFSDGNKYRLNLQKEYSYEPQYSDYEKLNAEAIMEAHRRNPKKTVLYASYGVTLFDPKGKIEIKDMFVPTINIKGNLISCI